MNTQHAGGQAAVGIELGGALGHDFLVSLGTRKGGVAHHINDAVFHLSICLGLVGDGLNRAVLEDLAFDGGVECVDDFPDFDGADDLDSAVGEVFR